MKQAMNMKAIQRILTRKYLRCVTKYKVDVPQLSALMLVALLSSSQAVFAKSGSVDYSWGADALANAHDFTVTMMLYVLYLCYAIAAIMTIISALQIYFKMQTGEGEVTKSIMTLIGACLFMIGASIVFPAFFGYRI